MVSLMPEFPLTSTPATPIYDKKRKYTPSELGTFQFDPALLTIAQIRSELKYYRDEKEYVGPRTVPSKAEGVRVLLIARSVAGVPVEQRAQAAPATVVGTNTSWQVLPEGATVVRRPGEVPRIPELDLDRPSDTRAAQRPDLVAPWTEWDANNPKGEALPSFTPEEKAVVRQLKKQIGKWLEDDRPTRQQADQIGAIRSTSAAYVGLLRSMWRLGLGRNEEELLGWDWGNQNYSEADRQGRWTRQHVDRLVCWITKAPLDEDTMQAAARLLREEADAELEEADEDMRPENDGITQQRKYTTQRCYFNALQVTFRYRNGTAHRPAQDPYYKKSNAWIAWLNWVIFAAEGRQDRDQKELLFGKTHKELLEIVSALGKEVEKLEGWQNPPMTRQEAFTVNSITKRDGWDTLFEWLALASMVLQPPVRGNWGKMKCTTDWELATRLHEADTRLNENFLYQKPGDDGQEQFASRPYGDKQSRYIMCINVDKVSRKTGSDQIVCSQEFSDALTTSFKMWPRAYAFPIKAVQTTGSLNPQLPLGERQMPGFLSKIRNPILGAWDHGKPMHQGVQLLRSSYVTWFYNRGTFYGDDGPIPDHNAKKALAKSMRHLWQQAETNYRKLPVVQQRTAVWDESIKAYRVEEGNRVIDHIGDPNLVMNPIPDDLKPTEPPEPPIYQSGAGSPLRRATADIPVDMEWVNDYMPQKMAWDITMATRGATDRATFQRNYNRIRTRQTAERNRAYHLKNKRKIVAKRILRRIALRGGSSTLSQASRDKYGIRTDAAGEFYSTLLQAEVITEAQRQHPFDNDLQAEEPRAIGEDERMSEAASVEPEEEVRDTEHEAYLASRPHTEWERFAEAEWSNNPSIRAQDSIVVDIGDATVSQMREYLAKLNRWKSFIE